ncbi:MAG TPA: methylmalonyl Co-A mutase-associated GTPase MeaB [Candidatus Sulfotelmatobacter sp.]|nr:methylmalonyl Co-A mutase-associated GTPase MeaB [Candidatus Sulfotelmatobacter sp.]
MDLISRILTGDARSAARLMSQVENEDPSALPIMRQLYRHSGRAHVVGITGPAGSGKSTLTDGLTAELRRRGKAVGIVAVDPTSGFTGGAILADRIRMQRHSLDEGVFIRSMATRGHLGGLSRATNDIVDILDAMGKEFVLIETVGVGQDEVDIVKAAHTTVVLAVPGLGDEIQAIKAGIMEIGDLFVVNKADRDGADRTAMEIEMMLRLGSAENGWRPRIVKTVAVRDEGIPTLLDGILSHQAFLRREGRDQEKRRSRSYWVFRSLLHARLADRVLARVSDGGRLDAMIERLAARETDPHSLVEEILREAGL